LTASRKRSTRGEFIYEKRIPVGIECEKTFSWRIYPPHR
jgi:hypothetical protein